MRLSITVTDVSWPGEPSGLAAELGRVAHRADEGGIDTLWLPDHLVQTTPGTTPDLETLEAYTTLGYLAALTTRIRLGCAVTAVTFRPPTLLIKAVTALDVLSGGRAWLCVGAGYHRAAVLNDGPWTDATLGRLLAAAPVVRDLTPARR